MEVIRITSEKGHYLQRGDETFQGLRGKVASPVSRYCSHPGERDGELTRVVLMVVVRSRGILDTF